MLTVTDSANVLISQMLVQAKVAAEVAARMTVSEEGMGLEPDTAQPGDATFDYEGRTILLLDEQISEMLAEKTLDATETDEGIMLTLQ